MKALLRSLSFFAGLLSTSPSLADTFPEPRPLSPHAWAWIGPYGGPTRENGGFRMNLGFIVGTQSVAIIDSGYSPDMAQAMLRHVRKLTAAPIRYVINTNSQPHRFLGNRVFGAAGAQILASREAAQRMANDGRAMAAQAASTLGVTSFAAPAAPDRLLAAGETVELDLGGVVLRVRHLGTAHTKGSLVVESHPDRVVFAGDILYRGRLPALIPDGSVRAWLAAYEALRASDAAVFVPGHGAPGPLADFEHPTRDYLARLAAHMDEAVKKGIDLESAKASFDAAPWKTLANFADLNGRNAYQAFLESEAENF
ncbi:MAG: MBL fold metallo-hydrolase [Betaproteobacteria bacterium]|nr:MBL fold metallo-hydrolase [Betaproteobacteria bacterium]